MSTSDNDRFSASQTSLRTFLRDTLTACAEIAVSLHGTTPISNLYINEVVSQQVNSYIAEELARQYPNHSLFTKGRSEVGSSEYEWICDPLDGAFIYSKGLTSVVISMTLVHRGAPILVGIIQPFLGDYYEAIKGVGVWKNGHLLPKLTQSKLQQYDAINAEWWPDASYDVASVVHQLSLERRLYPLHLGSVVYSACLVAEGSLAASLFGGRLVGKNHEAAAVMLLMQEAGGSFTDLGGTQINFSGELHGFIIASRLAVDELVEAIREYGIVLGTE